MLVPGRTRGSVKELTGPQKHLQVGKTDQSWSPAFYSLYLAGGNNIGLLNRELSVFFKFFAQSVPNEKRYCNTSFLCQPLVEQVMKRTVGPDIRGSVAIPFCSVALNVLRLLDPGLGWGLVEGARAISHPPSLRWCGSVFVVANGRGKHSSPS